MELFDPNGDEPWRNILWIIALAVLGWFLTSNYNDSVKLEEQESKYLETTAYVSKAEEWVRVSTKRGRETSRKNYFKFDYKYNVNGKAYAGSGQQDNEPSATMPVYYDAKNPSQHVLHRHTRDNALAALMIGGVVVLLFVGINIFLYNSKRKKLGLGRSVSGTFK